MSDIVVYEGGDIVEKDNGIVRHGNAAADSSAYHPRWKIRVERSFYNDAPGGPTFRRWMATVYKRYWREVDDRWGWAIQPGNRWDNHCGKSIMAFTRQGAIKKGRRAVERLKKEDLKPSFDPQRSEFYLP